MSCFAVQKHFRRTIMYSTKLPSLRIDQSDLKCKNHKKNGCEFFGNADWDGYCSSCYRVLMDHRRASKNQHGIKGASQESVAASFSKFEEKKRQQSDKKNLKYLKSLPMFRKSTITGSGVREASRVERNFQHINNPDVDVLKTEFISRFGVWGDQVRRNFFKYADRYAIKILEELDVKPIEEVAELVQKSYNMYKHHLDGNEVYREIGTEGVREGLLEFFERFLMVALYSFLFCPQTTNDEEKDLAIQERIRKLSWVSAHHLDCCISETSIEVRELVYAAIAHLLAIDSVRAPQEKLSCVVLCCQSVHKVLQQCQGGPVSADEFLPALIFVVLKANPARLKSNILYMTRFCNESRLVQGEAGYYFTNLCCAVSFIENLTAASLNMAEHEFSAYMEGKIASVSAWESALVACESMHQLCEQLSQLKELSERTVTVQSGAVLLKNEIQTFTAEILDKVNDTLESTPLVLKPRKPLPEFFGNLEHNEDFTSPMSSHSNDVGKSSTETFYMQNLHLTSPHSLALNQKTKGKQFTLENATNSTQNLSTTTVNNDFLLSPVQNSFDDVTPDDPSSSGLSKVNYDIDLSDLSAENSLAENVSPEKNKKQHVAADGSVGADSSDVQMDGLSLLDCEVVENKKETLPAPIKPAVAEYSGFAKQGSQIPTIPCSTGEVNKQ